MEKNIKIDKLFAKELIKKRDRFTNKGDYGRVGIIVGTKDYLGASMMTYQALCALRMGAGYSTLIIPKSLFEVYAMRAPQVILNFLDDEAEFPSLLKYDVLAIGMGLADNEYFLRLLNYLMNNFLGKLIIDGTGLTMMATRGVVIPQNKRCEIILTPHLREFANLYGEDVKSVRYRLVDKMLKYAKENEIILLVKDAYTFASDGENVYLNKHGNTGLAKAGSGDMLAGILAGLLAVDKENTCKNAIFASYILGRTAEIYAEEYPEGTMLSEDVIRLIPQVLKEIISED